MKLLCFAVLLTTAHCGLWGSSLGFLGRSGRSSSGFLGDLPALAKVMREESPVEAPVEEPLSKIAEKAEAEAWEFYTKQRQIEAAKLKNSTKNNSSLAKEPPSRPRANRTKTTETTETTETRRQRRANSREAKLITSLLNVGEDGKDTVVCLTHCRYGEEVRHSWPECLNRCVTNALMRSTFVKMLPEEDHEAKVATDALPEGLEKPSLEQLERAHKHMHKRMKSSEL